MRKTTHLLMAILTLSSHAYAGDKEQRPNILHVQSFLSEKVSQDTLAIPLDDIFYISKEFWRTDTGISCQANVFGTGGGEIKGTFECTAPGGYKAQIPYNCELNGSEEDSAILFFGKVGTAGSNRTFKVWCA